MPFPKKTLKDTPEAEKLRVEKQELLDIIPEPVEEVKPELETIATEVINKAFSPTGAIVEEAEFDFKYVPRRNVKRIGRNVKDENDKVVFLSLARNLTLVLAVIDGKETRIEFADSSYETDDPSEIQFLRDAIADNLSVQQQIFEGKYPEWAREKMRKQKDGQHKYSEDTSTLYQ